MKVIGHRGAAGLAPENTYASFDLALALGVDGIETDVQRTKDGQLVLFHDTRLEKTTNGMGNLQARTWQELRQLDAGSWFNHIYAGEKIPLLIEFLQKYGGHAYFELEVKQAGIEDEILEKVDGLKLLQRTTFTSQNFSIVCTIKERNPLARVGYITADVSEKCIEEVARRDIQNFCPRAEKVTKGAVDKWRAAGLFIRACGVKDSALMRSVIDAGVDGMTFDFPNVLLKELGRL